MIVLSKRDVGLRVLVLYQYNNAMQPDAPIDVIFRLTDSQKRALRKLGVKTVEDLLYHFPTRYGDTAEVRHIADITKGENATIFGRVSNLKITHSFRGKVPMASATLTDDTGSLKLVWFNQPYLAKMLVDGSLVRVEGKIAERKSGHSIANPKIEKVNSLPQNDGNSLFRKSGTLGGDGLTLMGENHSLHPVYPESRGVSSNWFFHAIQKLFKTDLIKTCTDPLPEEILKRYHLPTLQTALVWIHSPQNHDHALVARKRFSFEEVFFIQLEKQKERKLWQKEKSFVIEKGEEHIETFTKRFPFALTNAQNRSINGILNDFRKAVPMARLLEGDVGSGKTAVAATTAYAVITSRPLKHHEGVFGQSSANADDLAERQSYGNLQVAYMCPTEILARQQFENLISFFSHMPINIGLITSSGCQKFPSKVNPRGATDISRAQLLKWVANGEIAALVGTHSLIQKSVRFKHLSYVIIDEQHRFGVNQRKALVHKEKIVPHLLSMTATPIPRTLALTIYGDLDLTILDEMPPGRKPIITEAVATEDRSATYEKIRKELRNGRQCYIITPRIDEPDPTKELAVQAKSAKKEAERLKEEVFPEFEIAVMHGKLKPDEKADVMKDFKDGKINILVSTSVVEVGVNVENATVIVIEGAERFGLAQLHQLRGRVLRSTHQAYCFVFTDSKSGPTVKRIDALKRAKNGFELAEYDLKFRGSGQLSGVSQWGVSDVAMEALQNLKMVEAARAEAKRLIEKDETLSKYPLLAEHLKTRRLLGEEIHFE